MNDLDKIIFTNRYKLGVLKQGKVRADIFETLIFLSKINSSKVISALRDHLVNGCSRKEACINNELALGYFSISLKKINDTNNCIVGLLHFYKTSMEEHD